MNPTIRVTEGDNLNFSFLMIRSKENHRLMEVELGCEVRHCSGNVLPAFNKKYYIE